MESDRRTLAEDRHRQLFAELCNCEARGTQAGIRYITERIDAFATAPSRCWAAIAYHRTELITVAACAMQITVEIPDEIAQRLDQAWGSLSRRLLEMVVADAYRCGEVSTAEVR